MSEQATALCAELIRRRVVPRDELPELQDDLALREEVSQHLAHVGLVLLDRPNVPYFGIAMSAAYRTGENTSEQNLDSRALGLLLYLWLRLVAPFVYGDQPLEYEQRTITSSALLAELPGGWSPTILQRYLGTLRRHRFIETQHGTGAVCAGPMLRLAIDHDKLSLFLRESRGLPKAMERYLREQSLADPIAAESETGEA